MYAVEPQPSWMMIFIAIFAFGVFVRLASAKRVGLLAVLLLLGGVCLLYGFREAQMAPPPIPMQPALITMPAAPLQVVMVKEAPTPPPAEKPARPKRGPKPKPAEKAAPGGPPVPSEVAAPESPPEPPVAAVAETAEEATQAEAVTKEAPIMLYHAWSTTGRAIDSLPAWVNEPNNPKSARASFSSDRFATIEEAERQLWGKARGFVHTDLKQRIPDTFHWAIPTDVLKSSGLILERCVERTAIEVGKFVEPMYRVHWKVVLSENVRQVVIDAWRPTAQAERLKVSTLGFLGAAALFAFLNVILRFAPCPNAKKAPPPAAA